LERARVGEQTGGLLWRVSRQRRRWRRGVERAWSASVPWSASLEDVELQRASADRQAVRGERDRHGRVDIRACGHTLGLADVTMSDDGSRAHTHRRLGLDLAIPAQP
jgi:hypothetical protein